MEMTQKVFFNNIILNIIEPVEDYIKDFKWQE